MDADARPDPDDLPDGVTQPVLDLEPVVFPSPDERAAIDTAALDACPYPEHAIRSAEVHRTLCPAYDAGWRRAFTGAYWRNVRAR